MKPRLHADERRSAVIAAAVAEFAIGGLAGTSTEAIARRSGVSQPYLFQLFGTKKDLFLAAIRECFARTRWRFEDAGRASRAAGRDPHGTLEDMGHAYIDLLLKDRSVLRLQLHSYAACHDADVRAVVGEEYAALWQAVVRTSGASLQAVHAWFAEGMLINVIASISDAGSMDEFNRAMLGGGHAMA